jgi:Fe-S cluster assembly protein SufD
MKIFINLTKTKQERFPLQKQGLYIFFIWNTSRKITIELLAPHIEVKVFGFYIGKNNEQYSLKTIQHHIVGNNSSELFVKGVFFDQSKFNYSGLIKINKKAQKSHAYQKNQNILLSDECEVESNPNLEISANDVFCTHGSSTGRLSQDQILYLETRGIEKKEGEKLLVRGFADEIFTKMEKLGIDIKSYQTRTQNLIPK